MSSTIYTSDLSLNDREIRLLRLDHTKQSLMQRIRRLFRQPHLKSDPISCTLFKVSLDDRPRYDALSYVWGDPSDTRQIMVNGKEFSVTSNLFAALNRLRDTKDVAILWIDSICIDQSNISERGGQVRQMAKIYSMARLVRMWVGEETVDTKLLIKDLRTWKIDFSQNIDSHATQERYRAFLEKISRVDTTLERCQAFIERPYWYRVWVLQEVVLAGFDAVVHCGPYVIPWIIIKELVAMACSHQQQWSMRPETLQGMFLQLAHFMLSSDCNPFQALQVTQSLIASDPRDKIYGLLGLVDFKDCPAMEILLDYSKSTCDVYSDFTARAYQNKGLAPPDSISLFLSAGIGHPPKGPDLELPSWVPDMRKASEWCRPFHTNLHHFRASKNTETTCRVSKSPTGIYNVLEVKVIIVDCVAFASRLENNSFNVCDQALLEKIVAMDMTESCAHPSGVAFFNVLFRTITLNIPGALYGINNFRDPIHSHELHSLIRGFIIELCHMLRQSNIVNKFVGALLESFDWADSPWPRESFVQMSIRENVEATYAQFVLKSSAFRSQEYGGTLFFSTNDYIGFGPPGITNGDFLCVVFGFPMPVLMRREGEYYRLVGPCYVYGLMDGEIIDQLEARLMDIKVETSKLM